MEITKNFIRSIYNKLTEEVKKDKYKNVYAFMGNTPLVIDNNIEKNITIFKTDTVICIIHLGYSYESYHLDDFRKIFKEVIDFTKLKLKNRVHYNLQNLLDDEVIINKTDFLKILTKEINICLLKDVNLKNLDVESLTTLYFDIIFNDFKWKDKVEKYL